MAAPLSIDGSGLEVTSPDGLRHFIRIDVSPFLIGRGAETGNHLQLADRRISRQCASIITEGEHFRLEDAGNSNGIFVNGSKIDRCVLKDGDAISFGFDDSYEITFRTNADENSIRNMLDRIGSLTTSETAPTGLRNLNLLLEATSLLHSQLPLDSVLGTMLDHAIAVTNADRGFLVEADPTDSLCVRLARGAGGTRLATEGLAPSQTALRMALEQKSSVITEDLNLSDVELQSAPSIVEQRLRAIVAIPLYALPRATTTTTVVLKPGHFLGLLYLDSRRPAAFSKIDRQILDALAVEAASILDNARLVAQERQRQRLEQELSIARDIQQALLPRGFKDFPHLTASGINLPCLAVGGDYFDVFPISSERTAFLIADVSGKGLGAALLTTMLQGALSGMTIGADPAQIFHLINRFLCQHPEVDRQATVFFGIVDLHGRLDYINAGHPPPLLLRNGEVSIPFREGAIPVGFLQETGYVSYSAELHPDDTLILFSDGVTEARDAHGEMYGVERLSQIPAGLTDVPLDQLQSSILESVRDFTRGASQADDITLLLIRYRSSKTSSGVS